MKPPLRLLFWLAVMDAIVDCGGFGSRLYLWAVRKASAADWEPIPGNLRCDDCRREFDHYDIIETEGYALLCGGCFDKRENRP